MEMEKLLKVIGDVDENFIAETANYPQRAAKGASLFLRVAAAACFAMVIGATVYLAHLSESSAVAPAESCTELTEDLALAIARDMTDSINEIPLFFSETLGYLRSWVLGEVLSVEITGYDSFTAQMYASSQVYVFTPSEFSDSEAFENFRTEAELKEAIFWVYFKLTEDGWHIDGSNLERQFAVRGQKNGR